METENQYTQSITQSTHFLAGVALFNHRATEERGHTHGDVTTYFNLVLGDRHFVDACVFLNMCESEGSNKAAHCDSYANK